MILFALLAQITPKPEVDSTLRHTIIEKVQSLSQMTGQEIVSMIVKDTVTVVLKLLIALAVFYIGRWLIRRVRKMMVRILEKRKVDVSLRSFLISLVTITLMIFLIMVIPPYMFFGTIRV